MLIVYQFPCSTMWIFMLMMIVLTRARPEEDSRAPTNPLVAEGSASARVPRKNCRCKSKDITTTDKATKAFVGTSATDFATELGIIVRDVFPMRFHKWDSIPEDVKTLIHEKLEVGVGPVLRKNNNWMKSAVESSQRDSIENEDLRNQVTKLKEELK
ncbi:hypothetical protein Hanom_Chr16g01483081 [Helianthus anomalus]